MNTHYADKRLLELLAIPSPCGFTDEIARYVCAQLDELGIRYDLTRRGTVRAKIAGRDQNHARALVTHLDTIGAMVRYIHDDGRLSIWPIGHWNSRFAEGARVTVFTQDAAIRGTLLPIVEWGVSQDRGSDRTSLDWEGIELRLDEHISSAADVRELGVEVGNVVALDSNAEALPNGYFVGRTLDSKAGVAIVLNALQQTVHEDRVPEHDLYVLFTVSETIGTGVGSAVLPEVSELVNVDFASSEPRGLSNPGTITLAAADASGPYDYHLNRHLAELAEANNIPFQRKILKAFHGDAASALAAGHDVRTAVLACAGHATHSIERVHSSSLNNTSAMVCHYIHSAPTFAKDEAIVSVDEFSRQITEDNQPPSPMDVPDFADVFAGGTDKI